MSIADFKDKSETADPVVEVKLPKLKEKIILLNLLPDSSKVLIAKNNDTEILGFEYDPKCGSFFSNINVQLRSLGLIPENQTLGKDKLIPIFDQVVDNTVYRVFILNKLISEVPDKLDYIKIKKLTNANNPNHKVYLELFLKIFSSLELTSFFKT